MHNIGKVFWKKIERTIKGKIIWKNYNKIINIYFDCIFMKMYKRKTFKKSKFKKSGYYSNEFRPNAT